MTPGGEAMTKWLARAIALLATPVLATSLAPSALAQSYPNQPIKLIVPFPPGGVNDAVARPFAEKFSNILGNMVIENRGGAGGMIGGTAVARAEPDGYTLLLGSGATHLVGPLITPTKTFDPIKDFKPVSILSVSGLAITTHPFLPVKSLKELLDYAKANPGALSYGSAGVGSATHLGAELFKSLIKDQSIQHVPYRGGGPAITDLAAGHIKLAFLNVSGQLIALHKAGNIRILAVTSAARNAGAPEIETAVEAGVPGMVAVNFAGLFAPAGTPDSIIAQLGEATRKAMANAELRDVYDKAGLEASSEDTPAKASKFIEDEIARWTPVIRSINLKAD